VTPFLGRAGWALALVPLALALAGCGSGGGGSAAQSDGSTATAAPQQSNAALESAGQTVQAAMASYLAVAGHCGQKSSSAVCLEAIDRTLGDKIHAYANLLARREPGAASRSDLRTALNAAQTLANSLEILGDAQPTQANYDQVRNTFNVDSAITQLQGDINALRTSLGS
jgi:hypothetical protein